MNILQNRTFACVAFGYVGTLAFLGFLAGIIYYMDPQSQTTHIPEWFYFDLLKPSIFIGMGITALVCLLKGEGKKAKIYGVLTGLSALLFNPFFDPPFMSREYWMAADVLVVVLCLMAIHNAASGEFWVKK